MKLTSFAINSALNLNISCDQSHLLSLINKINKKQGHIFGVFVSVKRGQKLKDWPEDIHGCIGYWDNKYKKLENTDLLNHIQRVSNDATWIDSRKKYFSNPVYEDILTNYELYYMKLPLYVINKNGFIIFNNSKSILVIVLAMLEYSFTVDINVAKRALLTYFIISADREFTSTLSQSQGSYISHSFDRVAESS